MQLLYKPPRLSKATIKLANASPYGRFRVGAIVANKNKILSMGFNQKKTHRIQKAYCRFERLEPWMHAEVHAISLADKNELIGSDIHVMRVLKDGTLGNSRPCSGCLIALHDFGIKRTFFWQDGEYFCEVI